MLGIGGFLAEGDMQGGVMSAAENRSALIATLPKSGTWYASLFFWYYDELLKRHDAGAEDAAAEAVHALELALKNGKLPMHRHVNNTLGIGHLFLCHTLCPGFYHLNDPRLGLWKALHFISESNNGGEEYLRDIGHWDALAPQLHPEARIVYLYRNPLDHFVSYFRHSEHHVDPDHRHKLLASGALVPIETPRDMAMNGGISGFIKHYYTFRQMQRVFPAQVMMVSYEELTAHSRRAFHSILSFMQAAPRNERETRCFHTALALCEKSSVMALEERLGRALGADQSVAGERHVRDGAIGKWKQYFSEADLKEIEAAFNLFDMSLAEFKLTEDETEKPLAWLPGFAEADRQHGQITFLKRRLMVSALLADRQVQRLKSSSFWCVTAPLRAARRLLRSRFS